MVKVPAYFLQIMIAGSRWIWWTEPTSRARSRCDAITHCWVRLGKRSVLTRDSSEMEAVAPVGLFTSRFKPPDLLLRFQDPTLDPPVWFETHSLQQMLDSAPPWASGRQLNWFWIIWGRQRLLRIYALASIASLPSMAIIVKKFNPAIL